MNCIACEEVITNPLCPCCLHDEMRQWLVEESAERIADVLKAFTASIVQSGETHCIKCFRAMSVCTYCYTRDVLDLVRHDKHLLSQYLTYFNFDLGHLGWEQEARAYLEE